MLKNPPLPTAARPRRSPRFETELRQELSCLETPVISEQILRRRGLTDNRPVHALDDPSDPQNPRSESHDQARRFRAKVLSRLELEEEDELAEKLRKCGELTVIICTGCGGKHEAEKRCSLKWCPVCQRKRATQRSLRYEKAAAAMKWPMHITLTRANLATISQADVHALKKAFKALRRQVLWKTNVLGGIVSVELTNTGKGWHPHMHILADCEWLAVETPKPQRWHSRERKKQLCKSASQELERAWSTCIDQLVSSIKVRRCDGITAVREVLKYAVKGSDLADSPEAIGPAIRAISAGRLCTPFGSLYGLDLKDAKKPPLKCQCGEASWMLESVVEHLRTTRPRKRPTRMR